VTAHRAARGTRVPGHQFVADPDMPADHRGRRTCGTCRMTGTPGDAHHPTTPPLPRTRPLTPDAAAAVRRREAAILGEKEDD
jgi:hypothetical protein